MNLSYPRFQDSHATRASLPSTEHVVQDARTRGKEKSSPEKEKEKKPKKGGKTVLTIAITILCFSFTLIGADLLSGRSTLSEYIALFREKKKVNEEVYYAVYATAATDMALSYKNASAVRVEGGAGYVLKDNETYYVVLNVYSSQADAEKVATRQKNYGIYEIKIRPFSAEKYPSLENARPSKDVYREAYDFLYAAANDLASGKFNQEDFTREVQRYKEIIMAKESAYHEAIKGKEDTPALEYKIMLAEIRSAFENLSAGSEKPISDARYFATMILHGYSLFSAKYYEK